jgi:hypothetical protein
VSSFASTTLGTTVREPVPDTPSPTAVTTTVPLEVPAVFTTAVESDLAVTVVPTGPVDVNVNFADGIGTVLPAGWARACTNIESPATMALVSNFTSTLLASNATVKSSVDFVPQLVAVTRTAPGLSARRTPAWSTDATVVSEEEKEAGTSVLTLPTLFSMRTVTTTVSETRAGE